MYARFRDIKKGPQINVRDHHNRSSTMVKQQFSQKLAFFNYLVFCVYPPRYARFWEVKKGPQSNVRNLRDPSESWFYHGKTTIITELRFFFGKNTPGSLRGRDRSGVGPV